MTTVLLLAFTAIFGISSSQVTFVDVTREAGIEFIHDQGTKLTLLPEVMGSGCAFADYDGDGDLDIYLVNGTGPTNGRDKRTIPSSALYRNNGDGTFTDVTKIAGVGDPRWSTSAAFADYDNDGYLDIYVGNYVDFDEPLVPVDFELKKYVKATSTLLPQPYKSQPNSLYHNNGDGTFTEVGEISGVAHENGKSLGVVFGDYDGDGDLDLYVVNDVSVNKLFRNEGNRRFTDMSSSIPLDGRRSVMGAIFGDYDNDGDLDVFSTHWQDDTCALYRNDGGKFTDVTFQSGLGEIYIGYSGWGAGFFDYDNDGDLDIFAVNGYTSPSQGNFEACIPQRPFLFRNNGDGTFTDVTNRSGMALRRKIAGRGVAFGDYDNDGDVDILISVNNGRAILLRNEGGNRNNWLILKLVGRKSNRDGIGARVELISGDLVQVREVCAGSGYLSQSDLRVHFGLGKRSEADVRIRWPSGTVQTIKGLKANRIFTVVEPEN